MEIARKENRNMLDIEEVTDETQATQKQPEKLYSMLYSPDSDVFYLYNRNGSLIIPRDYPEARYGFSFRDDYNHPNSVCWAELLQTIKLDEGVEYYFQTELGRGDLIDAIVGVTKFWLDRGRDDIPVLPKMLDFARRSMTDPGAHLGSNISKIYEGQEAVDEIEAVFAKYIELTQGRKHPNYGNYWPNVERVELLERRCRGEKFKFIAEKMGRTNAAVRSKYGRMRRGEDSVTLDLKDWDIFREALPLGEKKPVGQVWANLDGSPIKGKPPNTAV
jgi:hypothetical protein